jgi:hypothetical protein
MFSPLCAPGKGGGPGSRDRRIPSLHPFDVAFLQRGFALLFVGQGICACLATPQIGFRVGSGVCCLCVKRRRKLATSGKGHRLGKLRHEFTARRKPGALAGDEAREHTDGDDADTRRDGIAFAFLPEFTGNRD